jgi:peptidoglycan L-alanyl-D-glutamate endopeptidase CwlK
MSDKCTSGSDLSVGMSGDAVAALQAHLLKAGFAPGPADGHFGPATEAAVLAFQHSADLLADGVVGFRTATALGLSPGVVPPPSMPPVGVEIVARMFPLTPLPPIRRNLPLVLDALNGVSLTSPPIVLAALATIRAETEGFEPLDEQVSRYNTSPGGHPFDLYDHRHDLGNQGPPDGASFRGRGFVQLTGRCNYTRFGAKAGLPGLVGAPDRANDPETAARLLAAFLLVEELPIKRALLEGRLATARSLVNGGTNGMARFADAYMTGAKALGLPISRISAAA